MNKHHITNKKRKLENQRRVTRRNKKQFWYGKGGDASSADASVDSSGSDDAPPDLKTNVDPSSLQNNINNGLAPLGYGAYEATSNMVKTGLSFFSGFGSGLSQDLRKIGNNVLNKDLNKMADGLVDDAKINTILGFYAAAALAPSATTIISDTVTPALSQIAESAVQAGVAAISAVPLVGTAVALPNAIGHAASAIVSVTDATAALTDTAARTAKTATENFVALRKEIDDAVEENKDKISENAAGVAAAAAAADGTLTKADLDAKAMENANTQVNTVMQNKLVQIGKQVSDTIKQNNNSPQPPAGWGETSDSTNPPVPPSDSDNDDSTTTGQTGGSISKTKRDGSGSGSGSVGTDNRQSGRSLIGQTASRIAGSIVDFMKTDVTRRHLFRRKLSRRRSRKNI